MSGSNKCPKVLWRWRPFYLTLLIFLLALLDEEGGRVFAIGHRFGDECYTPGQTTSHCYETHYCSPEKKCDCPNYKTGNKLAQFFNEDTRQCVSVVGTRCNLKKDDLYPLTCVPYASCVPSEGIATVFGACRCDEGYKKDKDYLCTKIVYEEDPEVKEILENSPFGSKLSDGLDEMKAEKSTDDKEDKNNKILVDSKVLDDIINNAGESSQRVLSPVGILAILVVNLVLVNL